jgi:4-aminobutyrate aminotransferase-like enzyme
VRDRKTKEPADREAAAVLAAARLNGILIGKGGLYGNVVRMTPPMNISRGDVDEFLERLDRSLSEID